jgi:hypothetical protein
MGPTKASALGKRRAGLSLATDLSAASGSERESVWDIHLPQKTGASWSYEFRVSQ